MHYFINVTILFYNNYQQVVVLAKTILVRCSLFLTLLEQISVSYIFKLFHKEMFRDKHL